MIFGVSGNCCRREEYMMGVSEVKPSPCGAVTLGDCDRTKKTSPQMMTRNDKCLTVLTY